MANPLPIKITELDALNAVSNNDVFIVIDKSDTSQSANGSTKNTTGQILKNYVLSGFNFGSVNNHTDITISGATEGQLLKLNAAGQWVNWTPDYLVASDVDLGNVVRDTDFASSGLLKRGAVAGSYSVINDNSTNWNTAYGWGNHATAGYLTSTGLGSISIDAFSDVDLTSTAPTNGQVLSWNGSKWVPQNIVAGGGDVTLTSFSVGANASPSGGGGLAYSNTTGVFTYTPPDLSSYLISTNLGTALNSISINALSDVNTQTSSPSDGQVLSWDSVTSNWKPSTISTSSGSGLQSRTSKSGTLNNLASNNTAVDGQLNISDVAKTYSLLKIETSHAAWVTLYTSDSARDADATRSETTDPLPGSGVIAEVITAGSQTQIITPGVIGWNDDSTPSTTVYIKVVNKSGSTANVTVTLTFVALEA